MKTSKHYHITYLFSSHLRSFHSCTGNSEVPKHSFKSKQLIKLIFLLFNQALISTRRLKSISLKTISIKHCPVFSFPFYSFASEEYLWFWNYNTGTCKLLLLLCKQPVVMWWHHKGKISARVGLSTLLYMKISAKYGASTRVYMKSREQSSRRVTWQEGLTRVGSCGHVNTYCRLKVEGLTLWGGLKPTRDRVKGASKIH